MHAPSVVAAMRASRARNSPRRELVMAAWGVVILPTRAGPLGSTRRPLLRVALELLVVLDELHETHRLADAVRNDRNDNVGPEQECRADEERRLVVEEVA